MDGEELVLDAPVESTETATEDVAVAEDVSIEQPQTQETDQQPEDQGDGRTLPKDIQRGIKTLRESQDPTLQKVARRLNDSFFHEQRLESEFPTRFENGQRISPIDQIVSLKAEFDAIGGTEGIQELRNNSQSMAEVDGEVESGNPKVLDRFVDAFPEGFKKLGTPFLAKLAKLDIGAYHNTILPVIHNTFAQNGIPQAVAEIKRLVSSGDGKGAAGLVQQLEDFIGDIAQRVSQIPKAQADDPRDKRIQELESEKATTAEKEFLGGIASKTIPHLNAEIKKALAPYLKGRTLSSVALTDLAEGIYAEASRNMGSINGYKSKIDAFKSRKDSQGAVRYINSQASQIASKAVKAVWDRRYGSMPTQKRTTTGAQPAIQGQLRQKPDFNTLDHYQNWMQDAIMGKGKIKGRAVSWAH